MTDGRVGGTAGSSGQGAVPGPAPEPGADGDGLVVHADGRRRCWWAGQDALYVTYHDEEWGVPCHDERRLLEKLCLEGFQAGLSWLTILRKRPAFRAAFADFDPGLLATYDDDDVARLLGDAGIVRHRGKIEATIANAVATCALAADGGSLSDLVWAHAPATHRRPRLRSDVPATTPAAGALSAELRRRGFRYVGPTTAYAFMQAMGLVDDHLVGCWRADGAGSGPQ